MKKNTDDRKKRLGEDIKQIGETISLIHKYKAHIIGLIITTTCTVISELFQPYCIGKIIDFLTYKRAISQISNYILLLLFILLLNSFLTTIESFLLSYISFGIENDVKKKVLTVFLKSKHNYSQKERNHSITSTLL